MSFIKRAWRGEEKLWKVFWLYNVLGGLLLNVFVYVIASVAFGLLIVGVIFWLAYLVWVLVSIWRCAFNVNAKFWGYLARIYIIMGPVLVILGLLVGGILAGQDLIKSAEERKICLQLLPKFEAAKRAGITAEQYMQANPADPINCVYKLY